MRLVAVLRRSCAGSERRRYRGVSALMLMIILLSGCTPFQGYPDRVSSREADLEALHKAIDANAILACLELAGEEARACRNRIIAARMYAIDLQFSEFEKNLFRQTRELGFAGTVATLGVTAAGTLTGTPTTQILSAIAAGLTGTRAAFEREILAEQTLLAIHTAMRANRTQVAVRLRRGLNQGITDYPTATALSDLDAYYQGGTILGALIGITEVVGAEAQAAERELLVVSGYATDAAAVYLRNFVFDSALPEDVRRQRLQLVREEYRKLGVDIERRALGDLVSDPALEAQHRIVARIFNWKG